MLHQILHMEAITIRCLSTAAYLKCACYWQTYVCIKSGSWPSSRMLDALLCSSASHFHINASIVTVNLNQCQPASPTGWSVNMSHEQDPLSLEVFPTSTTFLISDCFRQASFGRHEKLQTRQIDYSHKIASCQSMPNSLANTEFSKTQQLTHVYCR